MSKSYWQAVSLRTERDKKAILSYFGVLAEGMTPYKAEILCDKATDNEKKLRAFMTDVEGQKHQLERNLGRSSYSISVKKIAA